MDHTEIIAALGGIAPVAKATGRHRCRVSDWRRHGIPPAAWADLVAFAQAQKIPGVTFEALAAGKPVGEVPHLPRGRRPKSKAA